MRWYFILMIPTLEIINRLKALGKMSGHLLLVGQQEFSTVNSPSTAPMKQQQHQVLVSAHPPQFHQAFHPVPASVLRSAQALASHPRFRHQRL